ncbi:virulence-associated E family protein [Caldibacillus lycopersici]|uniref:Virulence-associated E family protein n=1 Tax=Perspicuibacillus lycopersici TaxID=1325689 RepID=A0AAE3LLT7_9BACI|nr:virulence-associated E family protein [Perspicuibacillus lycopersici]MCU9612745.1 virulence-associated E family protein [Perspicuibacillus lycopersici]
MSNKKQNEKIDIGKVLKLSDLNFEERVRKQVEQGDFTNSQALIEIAKEIAEFFIEENGEVYATVELNNTYYHVPVSDYRFERILRKVYFDIFKKPINKSLLTEAIETISAYQEFSLQHNSRQKIFIRVGGTKDTVYINLNRPTGEVVKVDSTGWTIITNPPVKFRKNDNLKPLPLPSRGGSIQELSDFLNVSEDDKILIYSFLLGCFSPTGPYPLLILQGPQGVGKSFLSQLLKKIVDPAFAAPIRSLPRNEQDLMISAQKSHLLAFDNLSGISKAMSDSLCKLSTGGGFATRKFYENSEEVVISAMRPVILNGIDFIARRPDLADRSIIIDLIPIKLSNRKTEEELMIEFETRLPRIFGALLDALSIATREYKRISLDISPRMADYAKWAQAGEIGFGFKSQTFLKAYLQNRKKIAEESVEHDLLISSIFDCLTKYKFLSGNATTILENLKKFVPVDVQNSKYFPAPHHLKDELTRIVPILNANNISYSYKRNNKGRIHTLKLVD